MKKKELLFSVTKDDLKIDTFKAGGAGGQNQNKRETGVRITHLESGAVGEARDSRYQEQNRRAAFKRMAESPKFKLWHKIETAKLLAGERKRKSIEELVDDAMQDKNLKVEVKHNGRWVPTTGPDDYTPRVGGTE